MVIRGTLFRLAAWYFLLLVLILGCLDVIVYFSLSEALHSRISADLQNRARQAIQDLDITQGTVRTPQIYNDPTYADTIIYVIQTKGEQEVLVRNDPHALGLDHLPNPNGVAAAKKGSTNENEVSLSGQPFDVRTQPVYDRAGDLVGVLQVAKPIAQIQDDLDRLARQLGIASAVALFMGAIAAFLMAYKSLRPLRVAFQRQREFVADASHELRTPLTLIRTNAEALLRRARNTAAADYAHSILEEVDQLNTIVSDLGTLALADARQLPVEREPVELERLVHDVIANATPLAAERGITLREQTETSALVMADPHRLRQLLLILLDNALTYTPQGGEVTIALGRDEDRAQLTVKDTGEGIPPRSLPHIFDRFYRADKARSRERGGTGLGLAIARWIVDAHKGEIGVSSLLGKGTSVTVSLPLAPAQPVPTVEMEPGTTALTG